MKTWNTPELKSIRFSDPFFTPRIERNRSVTVPSAMARCRETGRWDSFKRLWKPDMQNQPHMYWDSDVAKVLEGMANLLAVERDSALEAEADRLIDDIVSAQEPDGYLNVYFTVVQPEERWTRLYDGHELYCAGHLIEAAVAYFEATGKRKLLDALCRYVDLIATVFGRGPGQKRGYPGHPELELALVRLYRVTRNEKHLELARYFIDERGTRPAYFHAENPNVNLLNLQADRPLREMTEASGHAVRAVYLYRGAAEVAAETGDSELMEVCERLFESMTGRRMYVTGGIGSGPAGETFTNDFDLPNQYGYAESCASMGLVNFASRMLNLTGDARYAEVMERALYNGALSGLSINGDEFFYSNPLEAGPSMYEFGHIQRRRSRWFNTSCCPTSYCRFLSGLARFFHSWTDGEIRIHIPAASTADLPSGALKIEGNYPWDGKVKITILRGGRFTLGIRMPDTLEVNLDGKNVSGKSELGYRLLNREWKSGEVLEYTLPMPVETLRCNPKVYNNAGRIALKRGPVIYCLEECDNGVIPSRLAVPAGQDFGLKRMRIGDMDGIVAIAGMAECLGVPGNDALYYTEKKNCETVGFTAIPYAFWANRKEGAMSVWIREK